MFTHQCIKPGCENSYEDAEEDAYYCPSCNTERVKIAKQMDKKFKTVEQEPSSMLSEYDKARGNAKFPSAASLGIKL